MTNRGIARAVVVAAIASSSAACAPEAPCGLRGCDLRDVACQQALATATACLRGVDPVSIPVSVVSRADYMQSETMPDLTPEEYVSFTRWNAALATLNLAPANATPADVYGASAAWTGAFYSRTAKQIVIIQDGPLEGWNYASMLVHEYTHAIQDARFDLAALRDRFVADLDSSLSIGAITEGEATYVGDLASAGFFGLGAADVPWPDILAGWQSNARANARRSPYPVTLSWAHFRYPFGTGYVKGAIDAAGWPGVDALYAAPPASTREVIAGFGAVEPDGGPWVEDLGADAVPVVSPPLMYLDSDTMGAWIFEAFMRRLGLDSLGATYAPQLRADRLSIIGSSDGSATIAVWRLRFATAPEGLQLIAASLPGAAVDVIDRDAIIIAAPDRLALVGVPALTTFQAVPAPSPMPASTAARHARDALLSCAAR